MATAYVQSVSNEGFTGATITAAFGSNVSAGNLIALYVAWGDQTVTIVSVTDSLGNTYTVLHNPTTLGATRAAGAYAKNIVGGACTVTVELSSASGDRVLMAHEISGADTGSPLDQSALNSQSDPGTATDAVTSGNVTTTVDGCYIFGASSDLAFSGVTLSAGTGYTGREARSGAFAASEDRIQSAAGAIAATFTGPEQFADFLTLIMAFKPAAAGGGAGPLLARARGRLVHVPG